MMLGFVAIAGVVVTHHLTSFVLIAFLAAWMVVSRIVGAPREWRQPAIALLATTFGVVLWVLTVANETIRYLAPRVRDSLELFRLIIGQATQRGAFETTTGFQTAEWERVVALAATGLLLLLMVLGLVRIWQTRRHDALVVALAVGSLGFPASLALRLTRHGLEEATRTPEFVFLGLGFVAAIAIAQMTAPPATSWALTRRFALTVMAGVIFAGELIIGIPRWVRLPGPYLPAADTRSIEPRGRMAADWIEEFLGPGNRIAADRINRNLMGSEGTPIPGDVIRGSDLYLATLLLSTCRRKGTSDHQRWGHSSRRDG